MEADNYFIYERYCLKVVKVANLILFENFLARSWACVRVRPALSFS